MNPNTTAERDPQHGCYITHKPNVCITRRTLTANKKKINK
jgi:hypothetical protein